MGPLLTLIKNTYTYINVKKLSINLPRLLLLLHYETSHIDKYKIILLQSTKFVLYSL